MNEQYIVIYPMKLSYYERLEKMSINNKIKFETAKKEKEEFLKKNFEKLKV